MKIGSLREIFFKKIYDKNRQLEVVYRRQAAGPGEEEADGRLQRACQVHVSHSFLLAYSGVLPASHFHLVYEKRCGLSPGAGEWEVGSISILLSHLREDVSGDGHVIENGRWTEAILTWLPIRAQTPHTPSSPVPLQRDSGTSWTLSSSVRPDETGHSQRPTPASDQNGASPNSLSASKRISSTSQWGLLWLHRCWFQAKPWKQTRKSRHQTTEQSSVISHGSLKAARVVEAPNITLVFCLVRVVSGQPGKMITALWPPGFRS